MRTLSSTLLAAQKSPSRLPYVKVEIRHKVANIARLAWERLYTGTETDSPHAATMPGDGSLIRVRVTGGYLYRQRVTNPGPGSNFSSWTNLRSVSTVSGVALSSRGAKVTTFFVGINQKTIYAEESTDYGASWGSIVQVVSDTPTKKWLAADYNSDGSVLTLFYSTSTGAVYRVKRVSGTWGSTSPWSNSVSSVTGLGCCYQGDWNVVVTGTDASSNFFVWSCVYGDGYSQSADTWSALAEICRASAGSSIEFHFPFLGFPDVFRLFFVEKYTATVSYNRPFWSHSLATASFIDNLWREPVPFDLASNYSLALAYGGGYAWLCAPYGVWRGALSPSPLEVTADVVGLTLWAQPTQGGVRVELRNDDGRYNSLSSDSPIQFGSQVSVSPGYRTSAGADVSSGPAYWIQRWEYISAGGKSADGGKASFVLHATDGWGMLQSWKARRQFAWVAGAKNIFQLLSFIFARAGLEFSTLSSSSTITNQYPAFTIHPGESGASAVGRLLAMVPDVLFFRGNYGYLRNPQASDSSQYSYGTDHPILSGRYGNSAQEINRAQVFGSGVMTESLLWSEINKVYDRLLQVHDLNLDTSAKAQARGDAVLRKQALSAIDGEIVVPTNCGQELYDVIDITDPGAGLSAAKRRILGLTLNYTPENGLYDQRLVLGGV